MALVRDITDIVESIAGKDVYFKEDNVGLLLGNPLNEIEAVLCCLDVTDSVINQAIKLNARLIISHHPLIFSPITAIREDTPLGSKLIRLIKNGISVYCAHTNLDFCPLGVNEYAAVLAGLSDIVPMCDNFGRIGNIKATYLNEFAIRVQKSFNCDTLIVASDNKIIKRVAIINGAGGGSEEYIDLAYGLGADCLITSEVKHHIALYAQEKGLTLIEIPHFSAEYCFIPILKKLIETESVKRNLEIKLFAANEINPKSKIKAETI